MTLGAGFTLFTYISLYNIIAIIIFAQHVFVKHGTSDLSNMDRSESKLKTLFSFLNFQTHSGVWAYLHVFSPLLIK